MKILFVRHGKDNDSYRGGWSHQDLVPEGLIQAKKLSKHLKVNRNYYNITRLLSSDLPRAMTTANNISSELDLAVQPETKLREINNGDLAGMLNELALEKYPGLFFHSLDMEESYPNGESPADFYRRIQTWFFDFCSTQQNVDGNSLVVTHGGVINIIYHIVKKIEWTNKVPAYKTAYCSLHLLDVDTMTFETENFIDFDFRFPY